MFSNDYYDKILSSIIPQREGEVNSLNSSWLRDELYWFECNEGDSKKIVEMLESGEKYENTANSSLCYVLGVTDIPPKRRVNQTASSMPDIDFDVEPDAREFLKQIYVAIRGFDHVALLGTYQTLALLQAIKDVARQIATDVTPDEVQKINDAIKKTHLEQNEDEDDLDFFDRVVNDDEKLKTFFESRPSLSPAIKALFGAAKAYGIHAAGMIIGNKPLNRIIGLDYSSKEGMWRTQTTMKYIEKAGLIKYDMLAIRTLTIIRNTLEGIFERHGRKISTTEIKEDEFVLEDIRQLNTEGDMQIETDTAKMVLGGVKKEGALTLPMITQVVSLGRPGPMNMKTHIRWGDLVSGKEKVSYDHVKFEPHLKETYGLIIYQEQIIKICADIGKFPSIESVAIMKSMSKKIKEEVDKFEERWKKGASESGLSPEVSEKYWKLMASFAEYGFNKSHAAAYAKTAYIMHFLKYYYPLEFITAVLRNKKKEKLAEYYHYWQNLIIAPDVNLSSTHFKIVQVPIDEKMEDRIVVPFNAVDSVGDKASIAVAKGAPYSSFLDFLDRVDSKACKKGDIRRLILAGAFDRFAPSGAATLKEKRFHLIKTLFESRHGAYSSHTTDEEQINKSLFDLALDEMAPEKMGKDKEHELQVVRSFEAMRSDQYFIEQIRSLGFIGFDFMAQYGQYVKERSERLWRMAVSQLSSVKDMGKGQKCVVVGMVEEVVEIKVKTKRNYGRKMAFIYIRQGKHRIQCTVFMDLYDKLKEEIEKLQPYYPIMVYGHVDAYKEQNNVVLEDYHPLIKVS